MAPEALSYYAQSRPVEPGGLQIRKSVGNNAFLVSARSGRKKAAAVGHMQPVRGTLPLDRRKSCRELADPG